MIGFMQVEAERRGQCEWEACGAVLFSSEAIDEIMAIISLDMVVDERCRHLLETAIKVHRDGKPTTYDILWHQLNHDLVAQDDLVKMMESVPHAEHAAYYAKTIRECWLIREAALKISECQQQLGEPGALIEEGLSTLAVSLDRLGNHQTSESDVASFGEILEQLAKEDLESPREYVTSGLLTLDNLIKGKGWTAGQLITIGARPGGGKSSLLTTFGLAAVRNGYPTTAFSYEMTKQEVGERLEKQGSFRRHDAFSVEMAKSLPFLVCDCAGWNMDKVESEIRRHVRKFGTKVVLFDYLSLVPQRPRERVEKHIHVGNVTRALKQMAMRLQIIVLAAQQLGRGIEGRASKAPMMSDFKDSGSVEQDSDILIGIEAEEASEGQDEEFGKQSSESILHIMKQRNGPRGNVVVEYIPSLFAFRDMNSEAPSW